MVLQRCGSLKRSIIVFDETQFPDTNQAKYEEEEDVSAKICKCRDTNSRYFIPKNKKKLLTKKKNKKKLEYSTLSHF